MAVVGIVIRFVQLVQAAQELSTNRKSELKNILMKYKPNGESTNIYVYIIILNHAQGVQNV